ncbi:MAG: dihydroxyacetone kinase subunit DhaL [Acetobacteraceae bacterium]
MGETVGEGPLAPRAAGITPLAFAALLRLVAARIAGAQDHLSALDRAIGDGDHGTSMARGWQAAIAAIDALDGPAGFAALCNAAARGFVNAAGGATGPLYATILMRGGAAVKDLETLDLAGLARFFDAACRGLMARGKSAPGDKTMLDAWVPALAALEAAERAGAPLADALRGAASAAEQGARATREMLARSGRASRLGERSIGHIDPGAASAALFFRAFADGMSEA